VGPIPKENENTYLVAIPSDVFKSNDVFGNDFSFSFFAFF